MTPRELCKRRARQQGQPYGHTSTNCPQANFSLIKREAAMFPADSIFASAGITGIKIAAAF
jgi:hypothetical protein